MKFWIAVPCLALAAAALAPSPSAAQPPPAAAASLLQLVDDTHGLPTGCLGRQRRDGTWTHDCGFGVEKGPGKPPGITRGSIAGQLRADGYSIIDIEREGKRYKVIAIDQDGDRVLLYFDSRTGKLRKKKRF